MGNSDRIRELAEQSRLLACSIQAVRKRDPAMAENYRIEKRMLDQQLRKLRRKAK